MRNSLSAGIDSAGPNDLALEQAIRRAKAGDAAAFEQIIICYQHRALSIAWRMLGNREDARDAAQETFLRVYKYLKGFNPDQDFSGWFYRIVVNVCRDIGRKRAGNDLMVSIEDETEAGKLDHLQSRDDVEASAIKSQQQRMIAEALATLSKKERAAIVLRDLEGLPTEEVARALGSSQTTVRSQISTARAKIKAFHDRAVKRRREV
jgi:RNA polymerase sigma-70 factor (ECF subfamily)